MRRFALVFTVLLLALFAFELSPPGQALVRPWTALVASASSHVAAAIDGHVAAAGNVLYDRRTGFSISIEAGCNGVEAMLVLLAGIVAFPASARWKALGIVGGAFAIQALNIVRIVSLFYLGQWSPRAFEWAHLYVWQALIMLDALLVWTLWMRGASRDRAAPA